MARTTHRNRSGKKLYAGRDKQGRFKDVQWFGLELARIVVDECLANRQPQYR
jgi:hypothetical protein